MLHFRLRRTGTTKQQREPQRITKAVYLRLRCTLLQTVALAALVSAANFCAAQSDKSAQLTADPQIAVALRQISAQHIQANIEKLVSFGTRLTISAQDPESIAGGHGIGAAREWIKSEFERYSKDCGGCLDVKTDTFTQEPADRIPKAIEITNVYAVLKGTDAANAKRIVLVTGHYDSREQRYARRERRCSRERTTTAAEQP